MKTIRVSPVHCPTCDLCLDAASTDVDTVPTPGDFTLCGRCGEVLIFGSDLVLHEPSVAELMELSPDMSNYLSVVQHRIRAKRPLGK